MVKLFLVNSSLEIAKLTVVGSRRAEFLRSLEFRIPFRTKLRVD